MLAIIIKYDVAFKFSISHVFSLNISFQYNPFTLIVIGSASGVAKVTAQSEFVVSMVRLEQN